MRPVNKGTAPALYTHWGQARTDLANTIGWYCSYCEMAITNMIEVEHVVPRSKGGAPLSWDNFLLSCKYCNTVKNDRNASRKGYIWPDSDNCDLVFKYSDTIEVVANSIVNKEAAATIDLMGLDRRPGSAQLPTYADSRWIFRLQTWLVAKNSLANWQSAPSPAMATQIGLTAKGFGFFSVWLTVFAAERDVLAEIFAAFPNTYTDTDLNGNRIVRPNGII